MKVMFVCDWDFTYLWEKVAQKLQEQGATTECTALVIGHIYKEQLDKKNIFSSTCLLQDAIERVDRGDVDWQRLRELENKYAYPTLWRYVWADRSWVNSEYEEICKRLISTFDFYESLYGTQKPNMIVASGYGSMPHLVGHMVARRIGIPMFYPLHARIENRYVPGYSAMEEIDWIADYITGKTEPSQRVKDEVAAFLDAFREKPKKPDYDSVGDDSYDFNAGGVYRFFRYMYRYWLSGTYAKDHTKPNPLLKLRNELTLRIRRRLYAKARFWDCYSAKREYVLFPLHVQPEASTMVMAPYYVDQISVIANLSKSVPVNVRVLVKEHPFMLGRRSLEYYREIKKLPNVDLVHPFTDNYEIIRNACLIFTITGTTAFEAAILGKPAIMLGEAIYRHCPSIVYAGNVAPPEWPAIIKEQLQSKSQDDSMLRRYLWGIFERGFRCCFMEPLSAPDEVLSDQNVEVLSNVISNELKKVQANSSYGRLTL